MTVCAATIDFISTYDDGAVLCYVIENVAVRVTKVGERRPLVHFACRLTLKLKLKHDFARTGVPMP